MSIKVKENFDIVDYVAIVNVIAQEYFDEHGNYTPQIGLLNTIRVFYNDCIEESEFDVPHNITEASDMQAFINDKDFINTFNASIADDGIVRLNFANAYKDAMKIVDYKKNTNNELVVTIKRELTNLVEWLIGLASNDNIERIEKIAQDISNGKLSNEAIADAVGNSDYIKKLLNQTGD